MIKHPYYNFDKLMSYNGVYNFVCGARGLGKTFGAKEKAIRAAVKKGDQFIYLRRYKTELSTAKETFFSDIEHKFPTHDFKFSGNLAVMAPINTRDDKKRQWTTIGFFIALSTGQMHKSVSYNKVKTIIFDEFIIEKGVVQYLPNESVVFNNFFNTVDRYQDKTKVFFLANAVSIMNPYFISYEIVPDDNSEIIVKYNGFVVVHFPDAEDFVSSVLGTKFGKFIENTEYADYAVSNVFLDNNDALLDKKSPDFRYWFTLETKTGVFSVWNNSKKDEYHIQSKLPKDQIVFTLVAEKMDKGKTFMTYTDRPLAYLRSAWRTERVTYDKPATRNTFTEIFKR